jgi:hypothetical protein
LPAALLRCPVDVLDGRRVSPAPILEMIDPGKKSAETTPPKQQAEMLTSEALKAEAC